VYHENVTRVLTAVLGYCQSEKDPCVFFKRGADATPTEILIMYVDDFLYLGSEIKYQTWHKNMRKHFDVGAPDSELTS